MNPFLQKHACWLLMTLGLSNLSAVGQPLEMRISKGPFAESLVKIISKSTNSTMPVAHSQLLVSQAQKNWPVCVEVGGVKTNLTAQLAAYTYNVSVSSGDTNFTVSFFALVIESKAEPPLWWFCARPARDMTVPRDFKVFTTTNGNTYACYIQNGPRIFRVQSMKIMQTAWQEYWESWDPEWKQLDAVTPLTMDVLRQAVGNVPWVHFGSDYFLGVVDNVFEAGNELRVELHARKPEPKHTFALRNDKWVWVSSTGKEMTFAEIEEERRKALSEHFEAERKKNYGQTNGISNGPLQDTGSHTNKLFAP